MTVYRTCYPCVSRNICSLKKQMAPWLKEYGVKSFTHKCPVFAPILYPGDHVWARVVSGASEKYDGCGGIIECGGERAVFPGVFVKFAKALGRAIVFIEPGERSQCDRHAFEPFVPKKRPFVKVPFTRLATACEWRGEDSYECKNTSEIVRRREGRSILTWDVPTTSKWKDAEWSFDDTVPEGYPS